MDQNNSSNKSKLFTSATSLSFMTLVSRILGFIRDMILARFLGAGGYFDCFLVAFKIPNFMRRLFAEGAFAQSFIPVIAEYHHKNKLQETRLFIGHVIIFLSLATIPLIIIASLFSVIVVILFAPGFINDPEKLALTSILLKITFPFVWFISITSLFGAILNTYNNFSIPALSPIILNLILISIALSAKGSHTFQVIALAGGVTISGLLQLLCQISGVIPLKLTPLWSKKFYDQGVAKLIRSMVAAIFGVSVAQLSLILDTLFASFMPNGSISWLYYSERLTSFPLGVFGVTISTVILPHLAKKKVEDNISSYSSTVNWGIKTVLLISIPSTLGLALISPGLVTTLFNYGKFNSQDVIMSANSVKALALGLPAFMIVKILASAFYAQREIKTPVKAAIFALVTNMLLNILFMYLTKLNHVGLALATSISAYLNMAVLYYFLYRQSLYRNKDNWLIYLGKLSIANLLMALVIYCLNPTINQWIAWNAFTRLYHLLILVLSGILSYFTALILLRVNLRSIINHS